jgi:peptide/nickel transport system permease protein
LSVLFIVIALVAPWLTSQNVGKEPYGYRDVVEIRGFQPHPPDDGLPLGTVYDGSTGYQLDIWYSIVWGTRSALVFGLVTVAIAATFGILVGAASAFGGSVANIVGMGITDAFLALPIIAGVVFVRQFIFLLLRSSGDVLVYANNLIYFSAEATPYQNFLVGIDPIGPAFIALSWMPYARVLNSVVIRVKGEPYIQAARALGAGPLHLIFKHIIPNSISPALALVSRDVGFLVLLQAGFSFIGLTDRSVWGNLLAIGKNWVIGPRTNPFAYWWVFIPSTLAIVLFGIGWNLLGDSISDWYNRRNRA